MRASKFICGYPVLQELGEGTYGVVSIVQSEGTLKALKLSNTGRGTSGIYPLVEVDILTRVYHRNVIHAEGILLNGVGCPIKNYGLLLPLGVGDLQCLNNTLYMTNIITILYQVLLGL